MGLVKYVPALQLPQWKIDPHRAQFLVYHGDKWTSVYKSHQNGCVFAVIMVIVHGGKFVPQS